jgi:hypothetical protein
MITWANAGLVAKHMSITRTVLDLLRFLRVSGGDGGNGGKTEERR